MASQDKTDPLAQELEDTNIDNWDSDAWNKKMDKTSKASGLIGTHLLQGWTMLGEHCDNCNSPMMSFRSGKPKCVVCDESDKNDREWKQDEKTSEKQKDGQRVLKSFDDLRRNGNKNKNDNNDNNDNNKNKGNSKIVNGFKLGNNTPNALRVEAFYENSSNAFGYSKNGFGYGASGYEEDLEDNGKEKEREKDYSNRHNNNSNKNKKHHSHSHSHSHFGHRSFGHHMHHHGPQAGAAAPPPPLPYDHYYSYYDDAAPYGAPYGDDHYGYGHSGSHHHHHHGPSHASHASYPGSYHQARHYPNRSMASQRERIVHSMHASINNVLKKMDSLNDSLTNNNNNNNENGNGNDLNTLQQLEACAQFIDYAVKVQDRVQSHVQGFTFRH